MFISRKKFSSCFTFSFFSSFIDSCPFCGRNDTDIGRGSSVASSRFISFHFFQGFLFFYIFMILCFSFLLFDVILYSFFLACFPFFLPSLRFSNFFVFPLFEEKISSCFISSFSIRSRSLSFSLSSSFFQLILFHPKKNLSLLLCTCFSSILLFCF